MSEKIELSTLETIDTGFYDFINKDFDLHTKTNKGLVKVPVLWLSAERSYQIKNDRTFRDSVGKIKLPLISIERTEVSKDKSFKGAVQADIPVKKDGIGAYKDRPFYYKEKILQQKTVPYSIRKGRDLTRGQQSYPDDKFKTISKKKIVKQSYYVPLPVYISISYSIVLRTEYQQQMNDLLQPFISKTGQLNHFVFTNNNHRYEAFIDQSFAQTNNSSNLGEEERSFTTKITIKVLGYINGDGINDPKPEITTKENVVEVKISRERAIADDEIPWKKKDNKYRSI
jgi:hypothetical protein